MVAKNYRRYADSTTPAGLVGRSEGVSAAYGTFSLVAGVLIRRHWHHVNDCLFPRLKAGDTSAYTNG